MSNNAVNLDLIEKEYFHLQSQIEKFDDKSLNIKAWSVTIVSAIAGSSAFSSDHRIFLIASFASLMFWIVDVTWKNFQYAYYDRISKIESFMREPQKIDCLQIYTSWKKSYDKNMTKRILKMTIWWRVMVPHGLMAIIFSGLYLIAELGFFGINSPEC